MNEWSLNVSVTQTFVVRGKSSLLLKRSSVWLNFSVGPETC